MAHHHLIAHSHIQARTCPHSPLSLPCTPSPHAPNRPRHPVPTASPSSVHAAPGGCGVNASRARQWQPWTRRVCRRALPRTPHLLALAGLTGDAQPLCMEDSLGTHALGCSLLIQLAAPSSEIGPKGSSDLPTASLQPPVEQGSSKVPALWNEDLQPSPLCAGPAAPENPSLPRPAIPNNHHTPARSAGQELPSPVP